MFQKQDEPLNVVLQSVFTVFLSLSHAFSGWAGCSADDLTAMLMNQLPEQRGLKANMDVQIVYGRKNLANVTFLCKNAVAK